MNTLRIPKSMSKTTIRAPLLLAPNAKALPAPPAPTSTNNLPESGEFKDVFPLVHLFSITFQKDRYEHKAKLKMMSKIYEESGSITVFRVFWETLMSDYLLLESPQLKLLQPRNLCYNQPASHR
ncbi:hypothetical protein PanWU01x14_055300 [Parasponia andersonii]|uniref:Uncharacterized protein n=1 Tax=Parasponia andersonii TaxID=3476 RepID=A0A2P5DL04_PARAD|nr:hypothetical protein PanWU01x14_055300 [Parasponia andersonii]